ncbi:MAG: hypothetical protein C4294_03470, partial [Nitrospiraceae bacterium]
NQDEVDAFVLTYRLFTQGNDRISIRSLATVYAKTWMPEEARQRFSEARDQVNEYLRSYTSLVFGNERITRQRLVDVVVY